MHLHLHKLRKMAAVCFLLGCMPLQAMGTLKVQLDNFWLPQDESAIIVPLGVSCHGGHCCDIVSTTAG